MLPKNPQYYALITAAHNEEKYLEVTMQSIVSQTVLPKKWIIVDDGSTDKTGEIVREYMDVHSFIAFYRIDDRHPPSFGSQYKAVNFGYRRLNDVKFDYIGNLDADISLDHTYYESVLKKFAENRWLGIAGGSIFENYNGSFEPRPMNSVHSVPGAIQMFRRECFQEIGGFLACTESADTHAEIVARSKGWEVRSFPEWKVYHHRNAADAEFSNLKRRFSDGVRAYRMGSHPLFEILKAVRRIKEKPFLLVSLFRLAGYLFASVCEERVVSSEFLRLYRQQQKVRMRKYFIPEKQK